MAYAFIKLLQAQQGNPGLAVLILLVLGAFVFLIFKWSNGRLIETVDAGEYHPFPDLNFSTQEFYKRIEDLVTEKQYPDVRASRVTHATHGMLSARREYLRVVHQEFFFDICAAPFGKDFFVSWRQGALRRIQITKPRPKTFYERDTEAIFREFVKACFDVIVQGMQAEKGMRRVQSDLVPLQTEA